MDTKNKGFTVLSNMTKLITAILLVVALAGTCINYGRGLGRMDSMEQSAKGMERAISSLISKLDSFVAEGNRHTHEDAEDQHQRSFKNYVDNGPDSFWLAEPIHIDRNPQKGRPQ